MMKSGVTSVELDPESELPPPPPPPQPAQRARMKKRMKENRGSGDRGLEKLSVMNKKKQ